MESLHKGLIIEEVNSLVFETLHHMKDASETQAMESSFLSVYTIFRCTRDKIRLAIYASLTSTGYFQVGKK